MGLTIHYQLSTRRRLGAAAVRDLTRRLSAVATASGAADVSEVFPVGPDFTGAFHWPTRRPLKLADLLPPQEGWLCSIDPGADSEGFFLGLCRYAGVAGWRLSGHCKTQYAARHGWKHFRDCHRRVIQLLRAAEALGLRVKVNDEGGLWETGSARTLRRRLGKYDRAVAALGGQLKDAAEAKGQGVQGPIFEDPRYERLEAEGQTEHGPRLDEVLRRLALAST